MAPQELTGFTVDQFRAKETRQRQDANAAITNYVIRWAQAEVSRLCWAEPSRGRGKRSRQQLALLPHKRGIAQQLRCHPGGLWHGLGVTHQGTQGRTHGLLFWKGRHTPRADGSCRDVDVDFAEAEDFDLMTTFVMTAVLNLRPSLRQRPRQVPLM
eukprot:699895-Amphidinium_carterae.1